MLDRGNDRSVVDGAILLERRLTVTERTPATLATLFSTCAEQAEQVMPVTSNVFFMMSILSPPGGGGVLIVYPIDLFVKYFSAVLSQNNQGLFGNR